jgi:hypothetical protein
MDGAILRTGGDTQVVQLDSGGTLNLRGDRRLDQAAVGQRIVLEYLDGEWTAEGSPIARTLRGDSESLIDARMSMQEIIGYMRKQGLPSQMERSVVLYVLYRVKPGSYLMALLENDLLGVINRADDQNISLIKQWIRLLYNCEAIPGDCWGSTDRVKTWLAGEPDSPSYSWRELEGENGVSS